MALGDVHATGDQYIAMSKGMVTVSKSTNPKCRRWACRPGTPSGHLKNMNDLVLDGLDIPSQYKEGTDRNIAAQTLFGRGIDTSSEALELNRKKLEEAKDKADALGLAVGADNVEAAEKFEAASNDMRDILDGVKNAIGQALLPVLNDLATWFTEYGPQAMLTIRVAIGIVVSLFKGLALAVSTAATIIKANFLSLIDIGQGFAAVFNALLHGDFAAAKDAAVGTMEDLKNNFSSAMTSIMDKAAATGSSITDMWATSSIRRRSGQRRGRWRWHHRREAGQAEEEEEHAPRARRGRGQAGGEGEVRRAHGRLPRRGRSREGSLRSAAGHPAAGIEGRHRHVRRKVETGAGNRE